MSQVYTEEMLAGTMSGYKKFSIIVILAIMILGVYVGTKSYIRATRILSDHSTVQAKVTRTDHWQEPGKRGILKDIYEVGYRFNVDGQPYAGTFRTNQEKFDQYKSSGAVEVAYFNPNHAEFDRKELLLTQSSLLGLIKRIGIVMIFVILFFSIIGFIVKMKLKAKVGKPIAAKSA